MTDGIDPPGFILDFGPLNETAFDISVSVLPWVRICIGVNNIKPLTHEGWFEESHGSKIGKKNDDGIWMPYNYNFFMGSHPFGGRLGVEEIMGGCT